MRQAPLKRLLRVAGLIAATAALSGCIVAPAYPYRPYYYRPHPRYYYYPY